MKKLLMLTVLCALGSVAFLFSSDTTIVKTISVTNTPLVENNLPSPLPLVSKIKKTVKKLDIPASQVIYVNGPIGNMKDVINSIKKAEKLHDELYLLIDSPGGSVLDGALLISAMESSSAKVNTVCVGYCASMAFIIHQYGHKRLAVDRTILMAHPASTGVRGTLEQMESQLSTIIRFVNKTDLYISKRAHIPYNKFKAMIVSELWLDAEDAKSSGFLDEIVDINTDASAPTDIVFPADSKKETLEFEWK